MALPRRRGSLARTVLPPLLVAALLAACSAAPGSASSPGTHVPDAATSVVTCPLPSAEGGVENEPGATSPTPGHMPAGFEPVAAVVCDSANDVTDADGTWTAREQVRYTGDLAPLLAALGEPDERAPATLMCADYALLTAPLWLVDMDGNAVLVRRPLDGCGRAKGAADAALRGLTVESRKTIKVTLTTPSAALAAHCDDGFKLEHPSSHAATTPPKPPSTAAGTLRVCRYDVVPSEEISTGGGGHVSVGTFASGGELAGDDVPRALALAGEGAPSPTCMTDPTRFAVVLPTAGHTGEVVWVELDGCRRTWTPESTPRTAPAELLDLVAG